MSSKHNLPKNYFAEREEQAVLFYIDPQTSEKTRTELLQQVLYTRLFHIAEAASLRYGKFPGQLGEDEMVAQSFEELMKKITKFRPWRLNKKGTENTRAYSYLGTVVRNFAINYGKTAQNHDNKHLSYDATYRVWHEQQADTSSQTPHYEQRRNDRMRRVCELLRQELEDDPQLKPQEALIGRTLLAVFEGWSQDTSWDKNEKTGERVTEPYLRSKIMEALREGARCTNKEINPLLRRFTKLYAFVCASEEEPEEGEF